MLTEVKNVNDIGLIMYFLGLEISKEEKDIFMDNLSLFKSCLSTTCSKANLCILLLYVEKKVAYKDESRENDGTMY